MVLVVMMVVGGNVGSGDSMVAAVADTSIIHYVRQFSKTFHGFTQSSQLSGLNIITTSIFYMRKLRHKVFI